MFTPERYIEKLNQARDHLGTRSGPNVKWLKELEDDSKVVLPDYSLSTGIPTMSRSLNDFEDGIAFLAGFANAGKAQPLSSLILTPTGWIKMGEVEIGTVVCTPDGGTAKITRIFPQNEQDVYEVTLSDKTTTRCTNDHLWTIAERKYPDKWETKSLGEFKNQLKVNKRYKYIVPPIISCYFEPQPVSIDPYVLGCLLGDGGLKRLALTTADQELIDLVKTKLPKIVSITGPLLKPNNAASGFGFKGIKGVNPLRQYLAKSGLVGTAETKFVPPEYLFNSEQIRLDMLRGLLDTDGTIGRDNSIEFSSVSKQLANDVAFLARSLGAVVYESTKSITFYRNSLGEKVFCKPSYRVRITVPDGLKVFNLSRKRIRQTNRVTNTKLRWLKRSITKVELVGREVCQCIMIDHPQKLYITDNFIPTHNSTLLTNMMLHSAQLNDDLLVVDVSLDDSLKKRYQQYIASLTGLYYQEITSSTELPDSKSRAKQQAHDLIVDLYKSNKLITLEDRETYKDSEGTQRSINMRKFDHLFKVMASLRKANPNKKIAFFIDAWNNLDYSFGKGGNDLAQTNYCLELLKGESQSLNVMVMVSAHLRKTENKRPGLQDLKGTSNAAYDAVWAAIVRNEYRENAYKEPLMFSENGKKYPVISVEIVKSKVSAWDMPLFYGLKAGQCQVIPFLPSIYQGYYDTYYGSRK